MGNIKDTREKQLGNFFDNIPAHKLIINPNFLNYIESIIRQSLKNKTKLTKTEIDNVLGDIMDNVKILLQVGKDPQKIVSSYSYLENVEIGNVIKQIEYFNINHNSFRESLYNYIKSNNILNIELSEFDEKLNHFIQKEDSHLKWGNDYIFDKDIKLYRKSSLNRMLEDFITKLQVNTVPIETIGHKR